MLFKSESRTLDWVRDTHDVTIPVAERPYAAWSKPIQNDQPSGQPDWGSNEVKTNSADRRPLCATTRMVIRIAVTPIMVQKIAKVCSRLASEYRHQTDNIPRYG